MSISSEFKDDKNLFTIKKDVFLTEECYHRLKNDISKNGVFHFLSDKASNVFIKIITNDDLLEIDQENECIGIIIKNIFDDEDDELNLVYGSIELSEYVKDNEFFYTGNMKSVEFDLDNIKDSDLYTPVYFEHINITISKNVFKFEIEFKNGCYSSFVTCIISKLFMKVLETVFEDYK